MRMWQLCLGLLAVSAMMISPTTAQTLSGKALMEALQKGGYVLVLRHANSPAQPPDRANADPENARLERQLDMAGIESARAMGAALIKLHIPLSVGISSPSFRARQTAKYAKINYVSAAELDEGPTGMAASAEKMRADFLRAKANEKPPAFDNKVLISHAPNIMSAFGKEAEGIASGEMMVFKPGPGGPSLVARVKIDEWPKLAAGT
jgi:phosphohistidine phosphatase SixA